MSRFENFFLPICQVQSHLWPIFTLKNRLQNLPAKMILKMLRFKEYDLWLSNQTILQRMKAVDLEKRNHTIFKRNRSIFWGKTILRKQAIFVLTKSRRSFAEASDVRDKWVRDMRWFGTICDFATSKYNFVTYVRDGQRIF